ncbi:hypothetical protein [Endozoicomonas sp. Mp262]|uniref:hypothetical protein n=1 Tax=Endozoicomonas sp. Mp262 TaxID=2919499 RepID=UPI0021D8F694
MKEPSEPEYQPKDTVVVEAAEERFRLMREAYLEGRLTVDSRRLAEKIMNFERRLSEGNGSTQRKSGKSP